MAKHEHDFRDGFDVCVGNYGYYNEGELHDTWMRLPIDPDKIEPWLRSHDLFDEEHEEIYISDYDALPFRCPEVFDEYAHLDELNVLAMQLALLPDGALEHIDAAVEYGEPLNRLDEYSFEEIRDETVAEWRAHIAEGVVEKPVTPTDLARSASAAAATSAVIAASANQTAPKL